MLRLQLPLLSPTQAEQALGEHLTEERKQVKNTKEIHKDEKRK